MWRYRVCFMSLRLPGAGESNNSEWNWKERMQGTPVIEYGLCILCEGCIEVAPTVFFLNREKGFIEVADMKKYPQQLVDEAIKLCPADCISWE